jgi:haloacetate dehalogenase
MSREDMPMFEGFETKRVAANGVEINLVTGGSGPPLLLLHGYPQTHAIWRKVAPRLAEHYAVVASDLRGYGDSSKPVGLADHSNYSKRDMARDQVDAMRALGHESFYLVGHDRGARVSHRLTLDHPQAVKRLVTLDIVPTKVVFDSTNMAIASAYHHWFFMLRPAPFPETMIGSNPEAWLRGHMGGRFAGLSPFEPDGWPEYLRCFDAASIHGSCEDYRAAGTIDLQHDTASLAEGLRVGCPLLALWGAEGTVERSFNAVEEWQKYATDVRGHSVPSGHYIPEEIPDVLYDELVGFLKD